MYSIPVLKREGKKLLLFSSWEKTASERKRKILLQEFSLQNMEQYLLQGLSSWYRPHTGSILLHCQYAVRYNIIVSVQDGTLYRAVWDGNTNHDLFHKI